MSEFTEWFDGKQKPVHKGVYQRQFGMGRVAVTYCVWDGSKWLLGSPDLADADKYLEASEKQEQRWRGLASNPL